MAIVGLVDMPRPGIPGGTSETDEGSPARFYFAAGFAAAQTIAFFSIVRTFGSL